MKTLAYEPGLSPSGGAQGNVYEPKSQEPIQAHDESDKQGNRHDHTSDDLIPSDHPDYKSDGRLLSHMDVDDRWTVNPYGRYIDTKPELDKLPAYLTERPRPRKYWTHDGRYKFIGIQEEGGIRVLEILERPPSPFGKAPVFGKASSG